MRNSQTWVTDGKNPDLKKEPFEVWPAKKGMPPAALLRTPTLSGFKLLASQKRIFGSVSSLSPSQTEASI